MNIKQITFADTQYIAEVQPKSQIYLHHTAGNASGELVFKAWERNTERVATCVTISGKGNNAIDGQIIQGFSSKFWAYHLGLKETTFQRHSIPYQSLDRISIGIEICNWGQLTEKDGKFINYVNKEVAKEDVCTLDKFYKGHKYFHNYTDLQIQSVKDILLLWKDKYGIPLTYHE
jgi:N-acetyl-anhydromuramyl-L-alanine amidase AmpD